jgi:Ca2+-binding EF-hand superfamily protein
MSVKLPVKSNRRPGLNDTAKIREAFNVFDLNKDGVISRSELSSMLDKMGIKMAKQTEDEFFKMIDDDGSGEIEFGEFLDWYTTLMDVADQEAQKMIGVLEKTTGFTKTELEAIYDNYKRVSASVIDDGTIDRGEFRTMMFSGGVSSSNSFLVDGLFRMFDADDSGSISFTEFVNILSIYHNKNNRSKEEKTKLFFSLYDVDKDNVVSSDDLTKILGECLTCNNMQLSEENVRRIVSASLQRAGSANGLNYEAFSKELAARSLS